MAAPTIIILDANGRRGEELRHDAADHLRIAGGAGPLLCWSYVRSGLEWVGGGESPHFVVVSNAGDKEARKTAVQCEQIRAVFREALPERQTDAGPVVTILAVRDDKSLQELLPDYWTKGHAHPAGL